MNAQPVSQVRADFIQWVLTLSEKECYAALLLLHLVKDAAKTADQAH